MAGKGDGRLSDRLARLVDRMPSPCFAVLDGGHFDDLPTALGGAGLLARSLFLEDGVASDRRFGPWLVTLAGTQDTRTVLSLVGGHPAAVFWACPAGGEAALFRHLRRLNQASLPAWAVEGRPGPAEGDPADERGRLALFRHWDPRVLGALMPVLDERQFSRVLGPAAELAFDTEAFGGLTRVVRDPDWPVVPAGPLVLGTDQVLALTERRLEASRRRQAAYLRRVAPDHVAELDEPALLDVAGRHQQEALAMGIRADRETFMWSFMRLTSVADLSRQPDLLRLMADPRFGPTPEARLERLYDMRTASLRQAG